MRYQCFGPYTSQELFLTREAAHTYAANILDGLGKKYEIWGHRWVDPTKKFGDTAFVSFGSAPTELELPYLGALSKLQAAKDLLPEHYSALDTLIYKIKEILAHLNEHDTRPYKDLTDAQSID